jgi:hypothetical protein
MASLSCTYCISFVLQSRSSEPPSRFWSSTWVLQHRRYFYCSTEIMRG